MKLFNNWKKKYKELKNSYDFKCSVIDKQKIELSTVRQSKNRSDEIIAEKNKEIEEMQRKLDILYAYYDLDKEATQEIKTKVRIDERVRDLELENAKLKAQLQIIMPLSPTSNFYRNANACQSPTIAWTTDGRYYLV